jgi:hypothetical protein
MTLFAVRLLHGWHPFINMIFQGITAYHGYPSVDLSVSYSVMPLPSVRAAVHFPEIPGGHPVAEKEIV